MKYVYEDSYIRDSKVEDALPLLRNIRPEDLREVTALRSEPLLPLLEQGIWTSRPCFTALSSADDLILVFGVVPYVGNPSIGVVWLLGTTLMEHFQYRFLRESRTWLSRLYGDQFKTLWNVADKRNTLHLKWLDWLGFEFQGEVPAGINNEPFIEFSKTKYVSPRSTSDSSNSQ